MEARESKRASMSYRLALINSWVLLAHLPTMVVDLDWETDYELTVAEDITKACFWACLGGVVHRHLSSGKATKGLQCELLHPIPKETEAEEETCHHRPCSLSAKRDFFCHMRLSTRFSICKFLQRGKIQKWEQKMINHDTNISSYQGHKLWKRLNSIHSSSFYTRVVNSIIDLP